MSPIDGVTKIAFKQKSPLKFLSLTLPELPNGMTNLTCYVEVVSPSGLSKVYQQTVALNQSNLTVAEFNTQVADAVMDDLIESM